MMQISDILEYVESFKDDPIQLCSLWYFSRIEIAIAVFRDTDYHRDSISTYVIQNPDSDNLIIVSLSPFISSNEISATFRYFFNEFNLEFINSDLDEDIDYYEF